MHLLAHLPRACGTIAGVRVVGVVVGRHFFFATGERSLAGVPLRRVDDVVAVAIMPEATA